MIAITTTFWGSCATSILFPTVKVTVGYQYMSDFSYCVIHWLRFNFNYFSLIYKYYVSLLCFICPSSQHSTYLTNEKSIALLYFVTQFFAADKYIDDLLKASITNTKQTLKYRAISAVEQSLWGISWIWLKLSGFSES